VVATLNVQFVDAGPSDTGPLLAVVQQAFAEWTRHFDYTTGSYNIRVSFGAATQPADVSLRYPPPASLGSYNISTNDVPVGMAGPYRTSRYGQRLGLALTGRGVGPSDPGTLSVNPGYLDGSRPPANALAPIERELGHQFGIRSLYPLTIYGGSAFLLGLRSSVYDSSVRSVANTPGFVTTFNGPNAEVAYGGPVPVLSEDPSTTTVGGGRAVTTNTQGAGTLRPLDVALLRDAGVAALTDQELGEHQVARLYVAAFGRNADSAGLIQQYAGLRAGLSLAQLGDGIAGSAEFANRYGALSNADYVNALYHNVLGRPGDASGVAFYNGALARGASRGTILAAFADSDEERGRLNGNPNVTYAAAAEEQVARLYDAAFGRDADPTGFPLYTQAVINGTSLQAVALSFLSSPEFTGRYGANPSDQALVEALYQNTLKRTPDAAGKAQYVRALASGQISRADLLASFSDSPEHINLVAQRAAARDASGLYLDVTPRLGIIPVVGTP